MKFIFLFLLLTIILTEKPFYMDVLNIDNDVKDIINNVFKQFIINRVQKNIMM